MSFDVGCQLILRHLLKPVLIPSGVACRLPPFHRVIATGVRPVPVEVLMELGDSTGALYR